MPNKRPRCDAIKKDGEQCQNPAAADSEKCAIHQGKAGRKTLLDEHVHGLLVNALRAGAYAEDAARAVGIHPATYFRWMEVGEADVVSGVESVYSALYEAVTRARAEARLAAIAHIRNAMDDDWRAASWFLERTNPEKFGRVDRVKLDAAVSNPQARPDLSSLTDEELEEFERLMAKTADGGR